ncbi:Hypothetical Protein FCC1311_043592 [Hondaea fermentalgiana]|uniref:Protein phosphatase 1 regulatory subunit 21 N-terminal domain-containing protein n=1 Tax=Hondaea fermentalgiana TaxID=2315210 RepID=A0A2R5GAU1_9STRA|nr:Hypothetical Protein FCC1311_043592 [Hondaea fermentalgiana]|eukprot:GBG28136.1 Hypothetical Protein FCC1311_043592 [Hondaea fermentalgiana]
MQNGGTMDAEKKLRSDKLLLRRALLAEKETVAQLQKEAQARDAERRDLLQRVDTLAGEKTRLAAAVAQLKQEIAAERQAASANITGGSMFNTLLSSADGSTVEIDRLRAQIKLMEEELASQIKNTGKVHDEMHRQKRAHEYEIQKLRAETARALDDAEQARERMDAAVANLDFARRQATELRTQLDAKSGLAAELSRKLEAKASALHRLERLREEDLDAMRTHFALKVPFDDTSDDDLTNRFDLRSALVVRNRMRIERTTGFRARMQTSSSIVLSLLAALKQEGAPATVTTAVSSLCAPVQRAVATLGNGSPLRAKDVQELCAALARASAALSSSAALQQTKVATVLAKLERLAHKASSLPQVTEEESVRLLSEAAAMLADNASPYDSSKETKSPADILVQSVRDAIHGGAVVASEAAQLLQEQLVRARALDHPPRHVSQAASFWASLQNRKQSDGAFGSRRVSETMTQKCAMQNERLAKLEAQYQAARTELTKKEKLLEHFRDAGAQIRHVSPNSTTPTDADPFEQTESTRDQTEQIVPASQDKPSKTFNPEQQQGLYEIVVVDQACGDLSTNLGEVIAQHQLDAQGTWAETTQKTIRDLEEQVHKADAKATAIYQKYLEAAEQAKALSSERAAHKATQKRFAAELGDARRTWEDEMRHTKSSYDAQLQNLTSEMMRLQDVEQEQEMEINRFKAQLVAAQKKSFETNSFNPFANDDTPDAAGSVHRADDAGAADTADAADVDL